MIQRIQTIYLLLGALCMGGTFLMPLVWFNVSETSYHTLSNLGIQSIGVEPFGSYRLTMGLTLLAAMSIAQMVWALLSFRNLKMQRVRAMMAIIYILAYVGCLGYIVYDLYASHGLGFTPNVGAALPLAAIVACVMAHRGISRDYKLVRSVDRIR
ncbi:MAG: DUF4293 domain-containing protein [Bacteroidaceae bacterium]|nr:DUF4293 domain-containing protein [Bacteroidaceae bacterium]